MHSEDDGLCGGQDRDPADLRADALSWLICVAVMGAALIGWMILVALS
jgi:hypothetical protein